MLLSWNYVLSPPICLSSALGRLNVFFILYFTYQKDTFLFSLWSPLTPLKKKSLPTLMNTSYSWIALEGFLSSFSFNQSTCQNAWMFSCDLSFILLMLLCHSQQVLSSILVSTALSAFGHRLDRWGTMAEILILTVLLGPLHRVGPHLQTRFLIEEKRCK